MQNLKNKLNKYMNKEDFQCKLDNIITKKDELQKGKETFKANLEKLFFYFKKDSFNPLFEQLKLNIILIFDNYKNLYSNIELTFHTNNNEFKDHITLFNSNLNKNKNKNKTVLNNIFSNYLTFSHSF